MEAHHVILEPLTTEKAERLRESQNVVCFRVNPKANKIQIRQAVESLFEVEVKDVRTSNFKGKNKRWGRFVGRRPNWKKAFVTLEAGHSVEIFKGYRPMAIKKSRPTSPGRRFHTVQTFEELTTDRPEKRLTRGKRQNAGRNSAGRITVRFRGGGHKRRHREVDFRRAKPEIPARVASVEYDPNRSARLALLHYRDGEKRYILHAVGMKVGDMVVASDSAEILPGNTLRIERIPLGATIHNVELRPGGGGKMARSAGAFVQLVAKEGRYAQVRLPSGEVRRVLRECCATIGQVSNVDHENVKLGKAGRKRWLGRRPHNRGVTMNPVDHPHGGGEGKSSGGRHPVSPWGVPTKGHKTRNNKRTDSMIVRSRRRRRR